MSQHVARHVRADRIDAPRHRAAGVVEDGEEVELDVAFLERHAAIPGSVSGTRSAIRIRSAIRVRHATVGRHRHLVLALDDTEGFAAAVRELGRDQEMALVAHGARGHIQGGRVPGADAVLRVVVGVDDAGCAEVERRGNRLLCDRVEDPMLFSIILPVLKSSM